MSTSRMFASSLDAIFCWQSKSVRLAASERTSYALRARLKRSPPSSRPPLREDTPILSPLKDRLLPLESVRGRLFNVGRREKP